MCRNVAKEVDGGILAMRRKLCATFLTACMLLCSGCDILENAVSNIRGWDVSACVSGISVCWELFWDNSEKFEDGFVSALGGL